MNESKKQDADKRADRVNKSGYPLQLGLQRLLNTKPWNVELFEHAWRDPLSDKPKFIDIVARCGEGHPLRLIIEAKRPENVDWIFIRENETGDARIDNELSVQSRMLVKNPKDSVFINQCEAVPFIPGSPEVVFCVRDGEILEGTAAELVRAVDALAEQESDLFDLTRKPASLVGSLLKRVYVPVIVTTAKLFVCDADFGAIDFETGRVDTAHIKAATMVRFKKSFDVSDSRNANELKIGQFAARGERTVLVVQASWFETFLDMYDFGNLPPPIKAALFTA